MNTTRNLDAGMSRKKIVLATAFALVAQSVSAQTPASADNSAKAAAEPDKLETVTVTAQRREQELQKVPLPVSTFTALELETRGITSTRALADYTPNMVGQNNTGLGTANVYFIRGLGNTESISTFDPPVGTYVNDVYVARQNANNFGLFDVERIEVLRGPQGTLFGRNTTGGAINVILKKPGDKLAGYFEAGLGSFSQTSSRGSVDVPINDVFKTKFSYFYNNDDGYVNNITTLEKINAAQSTGVRGAARWRIASGVTWDVAVDQIKDEGTNVYNARVNGERVAITGLRTDSPGFFNAAGAPLTTGEKNSYGLGNRTTNSSFTSNLSLTIGDIGIDVITGFRDLTQKFAIDFLQNPAPTGGFVITNDARNKQFTQEIKATGDAMNGNLSYVAGVFYMKEKNSTDFADLFRAGTNVLVLGDRLMKDQTESTAVYGQFDYKFTPQLTATVGARYTSDTKTITFQDNRAVVANPALRLTDTNIAAAGNPLSQDTKLTTPRFALAYQFNPDLMVFGSATRGFKAGGWSSRATTPIAMQAFFPEIVWSYEAGWRSTLFGNKLRFNGTLFHMDVAKLQTVSGFTQPNGSVIFVQKNFADFKNQGLEIEFVATPFKGLNAYLNLGFQDAKYTNLANEVNVQQAACRTSIAAGATARPNCGQGIVTASGDISIPVRVPKKTVNPGATYTMPLGDQGWKLATTANVAYTSKMAAATNNIIFTGGHTVFNASVALIVSDALRFTLDCTNCGDKSWFTANLAGLNYLNEPRRYSLRANYTFK
jgi:iron complex outermembrane recepter protein